MAQSTQVVLTRVPEPTLDEMEAIVAKSHAAWLSWRDVSVLKRQKILFK
jgi:malonate-semialdehyde dehydrogenase (acetylating)/methylmalonate-semialdehyde dehydrogenase